MGLISAVGTAVKTAVDQILTSSPHANAIYFTPNFYEKANQWGLTEADAIDVYYHGELGWKEHMRIKKYNGYFLCIYHGRSKKTGQPTISTIWKYIPKQK